MFLLSQIPAISLIAVALLSTFTIGYFSKIGIHFIGLVDVSNLAYSFGLSFGIVSAIILFVNGDTGRIIKSIAKHKEVQEGAQTAWVFVIIPLFLVAAGMHHLAPGSQYLPKFFATEYFMFAAVLCFTLWLAIVVSLRWFGTREYSSGQVAGLAMAILVTAYGAGRYQAAEEIFSPKNVYDIQFKKPAKGEREGSVTLLKDVRIVRSSSNGFIIAVEGFVSFLPKDDVVLVTAQKRIEE